MKKLLGITIAMILGMSTIGCESTIEEDSATVEESEVKQEEQIEEIEEIEDVVEDTVLTMEDEDFKYYMVTNLKDDEYYEYFETIKFKEVEFDGNILEAYLREGYDTRFEVLLATGDYSEDGFSGPYIKVKDISGTKLGNLVFGKCNVKVKGTIHGYDKDRGYLELSISTIESR